MQTFWMVHGQGEFYNTLIAIFPTIEAAEEKKDEHPSEWQVSEVEIEVPFTLVTATPFTPSN